MQTTQELNMPEINHPAIGNHVRSSHDKVLDEGGNNKYDLLILDGSTYDELIYTELYTILGTNVLPSRDSGDSRVPYKIVGDLT